LNIRPKFAINITKTPNLLNDKNGRVHFGKLENIEKIEASTNNLIDSQYSKKTLIIN